MTTDSEATTEISSVDRMLNAALNRAGSNPMRLPANIWNEQTRKAFLSQEEVDQLHLKT